MLVLILYRFDQHFQYDTMSGLGELGESAAASCCIVGVADGHPFQGVIFIGCSFLLDTRKATADAGRCAHSFPPAAFHGSKYHSIAFSVRSGYGTSMVAMNVRRAGLPVWFSRRRSIGSR